MKSVIGSSIALLLLAVSLNAVGAPSTPIIGYVASSGVASLAENEAFAGLIQKRTGIKVITYSGVGYADLIQKMSTGKIDFAFLSSMAFVELEQRSPTKVLLKKVWDQGFYYSVWLVKNTSKVKTVLDLKGQRIAFVDEKSASGYLYPQAMMAELGLDLKKDFKSVIFAGSHDKSVELLRRGEVDAIAVFANDKLGRDSAWTRARGKASDARTIWSSSAIPNDPFCVRTDFYDKYPKLTHDLMFGLVDMNDDSEAGPELQKVLAMRGLMVATAAQYEPVRNILKLIKKNEEAR